MSLLYYLTFGILNNNIYAYYYLNLVIMTALSWSPSMRSCPPERDLLSSILRISELQKFKPPPVFILKWSPSFKRSCPIPIGLHVLVRSSHGPLNAWVQGRAVETLLPICHARIYHIDQYNIRNKRLKHHQGYSYVGRKIVWQ